MGGFVDDVVFAIFIVDLVTIADMQHNDAEAVVQHRTSVCTQCCLRFTKIPVSMSMDPDLMKFGEEEDKVRTNVPSACNNVFIVHVGLTAVLPG